jgi:transposase-like protein
VRWGRQGGSVYLGDQKLPVHVPRVRNQQTDTEIPLLPYTLLQHPRALDEGLLTRCLVGLTTRRYAECAEAVPPAFGLAKSTISRRFVRASAKKLKHLLSRPLTADAFVAVFLDGKTFGEDELVIALGVTVKGEKLVLGFYQTGTENARSCTEFLEGLVTRGLKAAEVLWVIDGAKGFRAAIHAVVGGSEVVQRCQWHKRENVVSYLPKREQPRWRKLLQDAYAQPTEEKARATLTMLGRELTRVNHSAAESLAEGLDETLTVLALGVGALLRASLSTTNCLESVNATLEALTGKVDYWKVSDQKQRWVASALLDVEPRLRRVKGHRELPALRAALLARSGRLTPQREEGRGSIQAEKDSSTSIVGRFLEKVGAKVGSR